ncbi:hypothetical protein HDU97_008313 [Phlyctochytrium planicorne]|nr:hypothetical protein HDU97_008313 [Phlyctochytrium planicorne]
MHTPFHLVVRGESSQDNNSTNSNPVNTIYQSSSSSSDNSHSMALTIFASVVIVSAVLLTFCIGVHVWRRKAREARIRNTTRSVSAWRVSKANVDPEFLRGPAPKAQDKAAGRPYVNLDEQENGFVISRV